MFMAPMAPALDWGLVFATPLTLILVPRFYLVRDDFGRVLKRAARIFERS